MSSILTVQFGDGDLASRLFQLKVSALKNQDIPALWRLTDELLELVLAEAHYDDCDRWPRGYITPSRLFDVPVDFVHNMPHLLCEDYVIYPYTVRSPQVWHA